MSQTLSSTVEHSMQCARAQKSTKGAPTTAGPRCPLQSFPDFQTHNSTLKDSSQIPLLLLQTAKDNYHTSSGDQNVINPHFFTAQLKGQFLTINGAWGADSDLLIKVENQPLATVHLEF